MSTPSAFRAGPPARPHRLRLPAFAAFALLGLLLLVVWRPHGPPATPDSLVYWDASRSWLGAGELNQWNGEPLAVFAPLYPVLLGLQSLLPVQGFSASVMCAGWMSAALLFWSLHRLFLDAGVAPGRAAAGALAGCLYHPVYFCLMHAWSEGLFLALLALWLLRLRRMLAAPRPGNVLLLGAVTAALVLTRYAGLILVPLAVLFCWIPAAPGRVVRFGRACLCLLSAGLPAGLWFFRNHLRTGNWSGGRFPTLRSPLENLSEALQTVASWHVAVHVGAGLSAVVVVCLAAGTGWLVRRWWRSSDRDEPPGWKSALLLVAAAYPAWIWVLSSRSAMDPLSTRLLAPAAIPAFLLAVFGLAARPRPAARAFIGILLLAPSLARDARDTWRSHREGMGAFHVSFRSSPLLAWFDELSERDVVISNIHDVIRIQRNRPVLPMPVRFGDSASNVELQTPEQAARGIPPGAWILWFGPEGGDQIHRLFYGPGELAVPAGLELVRRWPDASAWRRPLQPPTGR